MVFEANGCARFGRVDRIAELDDDGSRHGHVVGGLCGGQGFSRGGDPKQLEVSGGLGGGLAFAGGQHQCDQENQDVSKWVDSGCRHGRDFVLGKCVALKFNGAWYCADVGVEKRNRARGGLPLPGWCV